MSEEVEIDGVSYVSSRRAAQVTGYAQDYIGQLCRGAQVDARRIAGLWYVNLDSLYKYKQKADSYIPTLPRPAASEREALISLEGKDYLSTAHAADLTGYHKDYVGQLAREGIVLSRQVGSRWYVDRAAILAHKKQKDSLLGAVQSQAVGIKREEEPAGVAPDHSYAAAGPYLKYTSDDRELLPVMSTQTEGKPKEFSYPIHGRDAFLGETRREEFSAPHHIPIKIHSPQQILSKNLPREALPKRKRSISLVPAVVATIVVFIAVGVFSLREQATYALNSVVSSDRMTALSGGAHYAITKIGDVLEALITEDIEYRRSDWLVQNQ